MSICLSVRLCVSGLMGTRQRRVSSVDPLCIMLCCIPLRQSFTEPVARLAATPRQLILVSLPCCPLPHFVPPILPVLLGLQVCMAFLAFYAWWGFESSPHAWAVRALTHRACSQHLGILLWATVLEIDVCCIFRILSKLLLFSDELPSFLYSIPGSVCFLCS